MNEQSPAKLKDQMRREALARRDALDPADRKGASERIVGRLAELGVDGAVRGLAALIGESGRDLRRRQRGLAHQYYVVVIVGGAALVALAAVWR